MTTDKEIAKEISKLQLTTEKRRRVRDFKDFWLWAMAAIVAFDIVGRMIIFGMIGIIAARFGFYVPAGMMYLLILFMLAPFPIYLHMANIRKRLIALEAIIITMKREKKK